MGISKHAILATSRRQFLTAGAGAAAAAAIATKKANAASESFTFIHLTDTHIQPELHAGDGCRLCFDKVNGVKADFIIHGGDLVNGMETDRPPRAKGLYDQYAETSKRLHAPVHHVVGNHDVYGVAPATGVLRSDPIYGKRMFEDRIGKRFYSFAHKGWHFIALDSICVRPEADGGWIARIDDEQLTWLASDLASIPKSAPLVVVAHVPLITASGQYVRTADKPVPPVGNENTGEVLGLLRPYNLKAVLQGHTHIREVVTYNGCQFITSGAVCGNWWKGPLRGQPEGFGVITVKNGELSWRAETYGFHADPPPPSAG